jgi:hypothetical protein
MSLHTGDLITTVAAPSVRHGHMPSVSLHAGNEVRLGAEVLDEQCQRPQTYLPCMLGQYTR